MPTEPFAVIDSLTQDRDVVFRFFAVFSRFEYSLKRGGFLKKRQQRAEADWDGFANSLRGMFDVATVEQFRSALQFLNGEPPQTQIVVEGHLSWRDTSRSDGESDERYVLRLVRTVRNNLFHGGKFPPTFGPMTDVVRNRRLLEAATVVIGYCLELNDGVRAAFEEPV